MEGQINSAVRFLSDDICGGVLPLTDDVMLQLCQKHPEAQEAKFATLLHGALQEILESLYFGINREMVRDAPLKMKDLLTHQATHPQRFVKLWLR